MLDSSNNLELMGAAGLARVKTEYDADNIAMQTISLYQEVLK